jgi:predicted nucleic acid-binding protein
MMLVVDNNVFFSLMRLQSTASKVFDSLGKGLFAPEYIKYELEKHLDECIKKSGLSEEEFKSRRNYIESKIVFYRLSEYSKHLKESVDVLEDAKDAPYLALALSLGASIWSNDAHFRKQDLIEVYTTKGMVELMFKGE